MTVPSLRTLAHPGPPDPVRIMAAPSAASRHLRLLLQPGLTLLDALAQPLNRAGIRSASAVLLGGAFAAIRYCVGQADPTGRLAAAYSAPRDVGAAVLVSGTATLGTGLDGQPFVHCHAAFWADGQVRGGHLLTESCRIGPQPIPALVSILDGFTLQQVQDEETGMPMLKPQIPDRG